MTTARDEANALYEHLRTHGRFPADVSASLRREVCLTAWRAMPPAVKEELSQARASFRAEQHERLEREALLSLPPLSQ
jgi:hypothetical protein